MAVAHRALASERRRPNRDRAAHGNPARNVGCVMTVALADVLCTLAAAAPHVSVATLAVLAAACLAWLSWADRSAR